MEFVCYGSANNGKIRHHVDAVAEGFRASRRVATEDKKLVRGAFHLVGGLQFGSEDLMRSLIAQDRDEYLFFDRAYLKGGRNTNRLRLVRYAYQHNRILQSLGPRDWDVRPAPWRRAGNYVMLVPPSPAVRQLFGLGDWERDMSLRLRSLTDRVVDVSRKNDPRPLAQRLANCHAVVTWTSNVAVDAALAGVPVFVSEHSAAAPIGTLLEEMDSAALADPRMPDREQWLAGLAWGQFSVDEIKSGFAREAIFGRELAEAA